MRRTWRIQYVARENYESTNRHGRRGLYATWHQNVPVACAVHRGEKLCVMVSTHRDGEIIAKAIKAFRMRSVRGSSSRDGARALLHMLQTVGDDWGMVFTPDGPRGPRHSTAPGALYAAAAGRRSIVACGFAAQSKWTLEKSWDLMEFPKPFTRVSVIYRDPIEVPRDVMRDPAETERWLKLLADELHEAQRQANEHLNQRLGR